MKNKKNSKSWLTITILVSIVVLAITFTSQPARAVGPWYVAPGGSNDNSCLSASEPCATINGAIAKASSGDTINVATGTYTDSSSAEVVSINKSLSLSGGWNAGFTTQSGLSIIDGQSTHRGITTTGTPVIVDHFQIQHGYGGNQGGGIRNYNGTLTLNNSIVSDNVSDWMGGGIFNYGTLTINNTTISGNSAGDPCCSGGGGGGGIDNYNGTATLNNSTVSDNVIIGVQGSGIYASGTVILNNSTVSGNTGGSGEGIYTFGGNVILNNSTITNNQSTGFRSKSGNISLQNTLIAGNEAGRDCINDTAYSGTVTSHGYNLIGNSTGCSFTPTTGDQVGSSANPIDPLIGPLQDNGGPTFTHALSGLSPALNAGNPALPGSGGSACLATDQRGVARPQGSACDIGAYEGHFTVVASVVRANPNPTNASTVDFTVTFSEAVTGVNTISPFSDFALITPGITGASIIGVSGSGNIYNVTVNTGTDTGTIRLDVVDNDTILDTTSNPLGGLGAGNGNFTTGESYTIDKTAPTVLSSQRVDLNPTNAASVDFIVTFSEPVTGVDAADFTLTTTGSVSDASVKSVSGSDTTYMVTVNTGSGGGTIRLDVPAGATITDLVGNPPTDLPYIDGESYTRSFYLYLPLVSRASPPVERDLYGQVSLNGVPVKGVELELRFYDGSSYVTYNTTTTDNDGNYAFTDIPSLTAGQAYYVRYSNHGTPGRLGVWCTHELTSYSAGSSVEIGNFDIADIMLPPPPDGGHITVALPYTFQWTPRPVTPSDTYEFDLYNPLGGSPYFYTAPPLGYVSAYTLNALPTSFSLNTLYAWDIWVYSPDGGYGISYEARSVMFSNTGTLSLAPFASDHWPVKPQYGLEDLPYSSSFR